MYKKFSYFLLHDKGEYETYQKHWIKSANRRPHDYPNFLEMMKPENYSSAVAIYHSENSKIIYPFYFCSLNKIPAFSSIDKPLIHIQTPYGYGGPLYEGKTEYLETASNEFEILFHQELSRQGIVSEFVREDIFTKRLAKRTVGNCIEQQLNVVVRLELSKDEIWCNYRAKVRKNVKKAKGYNLKVLFDPAGDYLDDFIKIYHDTMTRTEASSYFFISKEKFKNILNTLGKDGGLMLAHVLDGDLVVSTELLLLSSDTIYSFLGGTLSSSFSKRPNDLLKHEVINWGNKKGYKWFVLGGGATPGDGIFKYKQAFDARSIFPFTVRSIIHDQKQYNDLIDKRLQYEQSLGRDWQPSTDFFPEYLS